MTDLIRGNQNFLSWYSCSFKVAGAPYRGILGVNFADKINASYVKGADKTGRPLGTTAGSYEPSNIGLKLLSDSASAFEGQIALLGLGSLTSARWLLTVIEAEIPAIRNLTAVDCRIVEVKDDRSEGNDASVTEYTIMPMEILRNGISLFDRKRVL